MIDYASRTSTPRGRPNNNARSLIESTFVSISNSPIKTAYCPSRYKISKAFKIPMATAYRNMKHFQHKRRIIFNYEIDDILVISTCQCIVKVGHLDIQYI